MVGERALGVIRSRTCYGLAQLELGLWREQSTCVEGKTPGVWFVLCDVVVDVRVNAAHNSSGSSSTDSSPFPSITAAVRST